MSPFDAVLGFDLSCACAAPAMARATAAEINAVRFISPPGGLYSQARTAAAGSLIHLGAGTAHDLGPFRRLAAHQGEKRLRRAAIGLAVEPPGAIGHRPRRGRPPGLPFPARGHLPP